MKSHLDLSSCKISGDGFKYLTNISNDLSLWRCSNITDISLKYLINITSNLNIGTHHDSVSNITDEGLRYLMKGCGDN